MKPVSSPEGLAQLTATLLAINPGELKGIVLRGARGECERWIELFASFNPEAPLRRITAGIAEERLLGGLDFAATIASGHAVYERGLFAAAGGGAVVLPAATTGRSTWQHVARVLDEGCVVIERDGFSERHDTTFVSIGVECDADESCGAAFQNRVALAVNVSADDRIAKTTPAMRELVTLARATIAKVRCTDAQLVALCEGASQLGIESPRAVLLAVAVARTCAALNQRMQVSDDDVALAAQLVFGPRAVVRDAHDEQPTATEQQRLDSGENMEVSPPPEAQSELRDDAPLPEDSDASNDVNPAAMADMVVNAVRASLPAGLLTAAVVKASGKSKGAGRAGADRTTGNRGRQIGTRRGDPRGGARLDVVATLRAAVPWQRMRREAFRYDDSVRKRSTIELRRDDFRVKKCVTPGTTTTLFVVDASGSSALNRLAEVKGAVELMLAEGYARRDRVALIAFRGTGAELLLPPTHALARARRAIAGMPAGGGTPVAAAGLERTSGANTQA